MGTNGIGTTLAAAQPLIIHSEEHFLASNFRLSCSVAPIFDAQGLLRGCLNATCMNSDGPRESQYLTLQLVIMYARLIENAHFRQSYRDRLTLSLKPIDEIADLANEQLLALDESGRVIGANRAAFVALELADGPPLLGMPIDSLLPTTMSFASERRYTALSGASQHLRYQFLSLRLIPAPTGYRRACLDRCDRHPAASNHGQGLTESSFGLYQRRRW